MLLFDGGLTVIGVGLWLFALIDVITTPEAQTRNLPKWGWLLLLIVLFDVGAILWLVLGRRWSTATGDGRAATRPAAAPDRPARAAPAAPAARAGNPDDDEEFLAQLRARAEEQRRRAREDDGDAGERPR